MGELVVTRAGAGVSSGVLACDRITTEFIRDGRRL
jgi:hypothetical protein